MTKPDFVHLHVHSEYSLLDGANRISDLVQACLDDEQPAIALTDHGNMFGAIELYKKCTKAGLKPILGCEVYVARGSRLQPHHRVHNGYNHLTLLARDQTGYQNLLKLASAAYVDGYHVRPRIDKEILARHAAGISCLSGCLSGEINQLFVQDKESEAERVAVELRDLFGPEHFWLELQRNGIDIQDKANEALVRLGQRTGIPLVATNDIHYLRHEDCHTQDVLLCINTGAKRSDENRFKMDTDSLYFRTREEMGAIFRDLPDALRATMDVAEQVCVEVEFGTYRVPVFQSDDGEAPDALFDRLCAQGLDALYPSGHPRRAAALERLADEKRVISDMGFTSYFLIVWDLIRWAREHGIPVGPGRGSAAGSIVAYALGITKVDPLEYDLLFERFLNSARVSMPDIDIDFCKEGRERVLAYTRERYGKDSVAQIVTFGTMASRTVVRDVGRVLDVPLGKVDALAKAIPAGPGAPSLAVALERDKDLREKRDAEPELAELFKYSVRLEGMARHISTHAAGVVIADQPIDRYVPLCTHDGEVATQWPAPQLEELGLLKMDYLGLRTLTILDRALQNIAKQGGTPPDLDRLPAGDPTTYAMLEAGDTLGVFQLESEGMRRLLAQLKPDCFEDLIAVLALYRPGPLESGMDQMFIRRKHGEEAIDYPHPSLEPILEDTYGCLVYQEQVMLIANVLGDFSLNEADNLRKAMGKKKPEIMQQFSAQFVEGAKRNGCAEGTAKEIWDNIVKFGGYGFNKSHSTAYAMITYQTAYLKANHRTAFLAANMSCEMQDSAKIKAFYDDAHDHGIEVRPPHVEKSDWEFEPEDGAIRYGFGAIKGTGKKAIDAIVRTRDALEAKKTLHALCASVDPAEVTRSTWEALIKAGAFDHLGHDRGAVLHALDAAMSEGARAAADRRVGQTSLFGAFDDGGAAEENGADAGGDGIDDRHALQRAEVLRAEYEVLGFYLSGHPLEERAGLFALLSTTSTLELAQHQGAQVALAGLILGKSETLVKNGRMAGQKMARFALEDLDGSVSVIAFPRTYLKCRERIVDDAIVVCVGKVEERGDEPGLILEEVLTIDEALARFEGGVVIRLEPSDRPQLAPLRELVRSHAGDKPLYLQVLGEDGRLRRVRVPDTSRVRASAELAGQVESLLGNGRVKLARY